MKYARVHNYSHQASLSKYKNESRYRRKSSRNSHSHSFKFYLAILSILISCGLYIKYQSLHVEDSLFYHLYQGMIKPKWLQYQSKKESNSTPFKKIIATKKHEKKPIKSNQKQLKREHKVAQNHRLQPNNPSTIKKAQRTTKATSTSTTLATSKQDALYYTVQTKKDSNLLQLSPQRGSMVSFHEKDYYYNLVSRLIEYKAADRNKQSLDVFSSKVVLLKSWEEKDTLLLDFNGAFQFSKLGDKGIILQIQQILWTIFRNNPNHIRYISFLIDGKRKINLGGHGLQLKPFYSEKDLVRVINFPRKVH